MTPEPGTPEAVDLRLDADLAVAVLTRFIADGVAEAGAAGVVLGLSGGIDSALAAALAVRALGPGKVHVLFLPSAVTSAEAGEDAAEVAASLDLPLRTIEIGGLVDAYFGSHEPEADELRRGNFMARARMAVLFDQSRLHRALVLGTSNKTEILLGYSTVFGDNASSLNPLGDLYKQQVWQLSRHLELPERVIDKAPSADLWPGQSDEEELGLPYLQADAILHLLFDRGLRPAEVVERGYAADQVELVVHREATNRYKRRLMLICRLSGSAINLDREIPRD